MTIKNFKIGDTIGYKSVLTDKEFTHVGKVRDIADIGISSCSKPMVKIEGKSGFVLSSHCVLINIKSEKND